MSDSKNTQETNNHENPNEDEDLIEQFGKEEFEDDDDDEDEEVKKVLCLKISRIISELPLIADTL